MAAASHNTSFTTALTANISENKLVNYTTSSQKLTEQPSASQYAVPQEQYVQNPTTVPESVPTIKTTITPMSTVNKHKELNTSNTYAAAVRSGSAKTHTRYPYPSNSKNTKHIAKDATSVATTTTHYGPLSTNPMPKREPLLPTPPTVACIIPQEPTVTGK